MAMTATVAPEALEQLLDLIAERIARRTVELASPLQSEESERDPWHLLNVEEVAARLGRSTRWVRERAKRGQLPFVRLDGGALAFELVDVQDFARERRISATKPLALAGRLQAGSNAASSARFIGWNGRRTRGSEREGLRPGRTLRVALAGPSLWKGEISAGPHVDVGSAPDWTCREPSGWLGEVRTLAPAPCAVARHAVQPGDLRNPDEFLCHRIRPNKTGKRQLHMLVACVYRFRSPPGGA